MGSLFLREELETSIPGLHILGAPRSVEFWTPYAICFGHYICITRTDSVHQLEQAKRLKS